MVARLAAPHCWWELFDPMIAPLNSGGEAQLIVQAKASPGVKLVDGELSRADDSRLFCDVSGKMTLLKHLLPRLAARGHRVLIFSAFKIVRGIALSQSGCGCQTQFYDLCRSQVLDLIEDLVDNLPLVELPPGQPCPPAYHPGRKLLYGRIDGNTALAARQRIIDAYNAPESRLFTLLVTTRSGGQGLNLATADSVILFDAE